MYQGIIFETSQAFPEISIPFDDVYYDDIISVCKTVFSGAPPWKKVKRSGLYGRGERDMALLNAAKVLCDTMSDLTFGRQADVIIDDPVKQQYVRNVLQNNSFWDKMPNNFSLGYALGGSLVRTFINGGEIKLDYSAADSFVPLERSSRSISSGIFRSKFSRYGKYYTLFEMHSHAPDGFTEVSHKLFSSSSPSALGVQIPLETVFPNMQDIVRYPFSDPMFSYFHPAVSNNILTDGSLGMSVFYNFLDTLKALDTAFDSLLREFILGRKRIIVPSSCIRTVVDPDTGNVKRYFDADDEVYQALRCDDDSDLKIIDNTAELRVDEHITAINSLLNVLCFQTGLSSSTLSFGVSSGIRTAAEINSQENRANRTMLSNRNIAAEYLEGIVKSILAAGAFLGDIDSAPADVRITFAKEPDTDIDAEIDRNVRLKDLGVISPDEAKDNIRNIFN